MRRPPAHGSTAGRPESVPEPRESTEAREARLGGSNAPMPLWAAFCFCLSAGTLLVFPLWCLAVNGLPDNAFTALSWLSVVYIALRLGAVAALGRPSPCAIMTFGWTYVFMVVAPGLSAATGRFPLYVVPSSHAVQTAQAIIAISLLAYDTSYHLSGSRARAPVGPSQASLLVDRSRLVSAVLGLAALAALMLPFTGLVALAPVRSMETRLLGGIATDSAGVGMAGLVLRSAPVAGICLALWSAVRAKRGSTSRSDRARSALTIVLATVFWVVFASPLAVPRHNSAATLITVAWVVLPWRGRTSSTAWALLLSVGMFFLFSSLDVRDTLAPLASGKITPSEAYHNFLRLTTEAAVKAPTGELAEPHLQIAHGVDYVAANGLGYGRSLSRIPLQWVPRSYWPDKPIPPGELITKTIGNPSNISSPLWLEGYADFGIAGALALVALWGWVSGLADARLRSCLTTGATSLAAVLSPWLGANAGILLRGSLDAGIYRNGFGMLLTYLVYRHITRQLPHDRRHV